MTAETDHYTLEKDYTLSIGSIVDSRYRITGRIGEGGMGVVYKAQHLYTERVVAVKMMLEQSSVNSLEHRRFQREAKAASALQHRNIVSIHDFGFVNGRAYISMDFVDGASLDHVLHRGPLSLDRFRNIFGQVCDALEHAHQRGIIHRDIKPSNLMISTDDDGCESAVILDFGLVKMSTDIANSRITATNMIVGSPIYMSPEQCKAVELDHRSDIYSLACVMYEALTGLAPVQAENAFDYMHKHINELPKSFRDVAPWIYVPPALERAIMRALSKHPDERPESMRDFLHSIEQAFNGSPDVFVKPLLPQSSLSLSRKQKSLSKRRQLQGLILKGTAATLTTVALVSFGIWVGIVLHPIDSRTQAGRLPAGRDANSNGGDTSDSDQIIVAKQNVAPPAVQTDPLKLQANDQQPLAVKTDSMQPGFPASSVLNLAKPLVSLFSDGNSKSLNTYQRLAQSQQSLRTGITDIARAPNTVDQPSKEGSGSDDSNGMRPKSLANNNSGVGVAPFAFNNGIAEIRSDHSPSPLPAALFDDGSINASPSLDQIEGEANIAFNNSKWIEARQKFEQIRSKTSSSEKETMAAAKLLCTAFSQGDLRGAADYLADLKRLILFNPHSLENDPALIARIYKIYRQLVASEDTSFSERLLRLAVEAFYRQSMQPTNASIHIKMELRRVLLEQGKTNEAETLLQECLREASQISDQNLLNTLNAIIAQNQTQAQGSSGGFGGGAAVPAPGANGGSNNGPGNSGPNGNTNGGIPSNTGYGGNSGFIGSENSQGIPNDGRSPGGTGVPTGGVGQSATGLNGAAGTVNGGGGGGGGIGGPGALGGGGFGGRGR